LKASYFIFLNTFLIALSLRVLRPPGGASNISFGNDEEKPPNRKNKMASNIFAEPDDPHAHRRNNPPGGKPTGVLCGEPSAPLRRCAAQSSSNNHEDSNAGVRWRNAVCVEVIPAPEQRNEASQPAAGMTSGRRNPPGGKSSLILG
uniref:Uncharacterized protein n=1 Tax=Oncorhynchus tshawytscha TaxID=74940 RepID=A0A8C8GKW9_ONCTS